MEVLVDDRYNKMYIDEEASIHYHITKKDTMYMTEQEFRDMLMTYKGSVIENKPSLILIDNRELQFPISPDLQDWITQHVTIPIIQTGLTGKCCFVLPKELISKLSISQLSQEMSAAQNIMKLKYFADFEEAKNWLLAA